MGRFSKQRIRPNSTANSIKQNYFHEVSFTPADNSFASVNHAHRALIIRDTWELQHVPVELMTLTSGQGHWQNEWEMTYISFLLLFSHSAVSDSLWPHGQQHTRLPCPSPPPRACSNSRPLSQWCHPTISPSVVPFSSCPQSFPASGSKLLCCGLYEDCGREAKGNSASIFLGQTQAQVPPTCNTKVQNRPRTFSEDSSWGCFQSMLLS